MPSVIPHFPPWLVQCHFNRTNTVNLYRWTLRFLLSHVMVGTWVKNLACCSRGYHSLPPSQGFRRFRHLLFHFGRQGGFMCSSPFRAAPTEAGRPKLADFVCSG